MRERGGRSQAMGEAWRPPARQRPHWWPQVRAGTLTHAQWRRLRRPRRRHGARLLKAGQACGVATTAGVCRGGLTVDDALWTFVRVAGLEPTNDVAERAPRPGVLWRTGSFGTQSTDGSRCVAAMRTVVATLRQQHRHALASLTDACQAAYTGEPAPSLLPLPLRPESHGQRPAAASSAQVRERLPKF
jgi:transposase